MKSGNVKVGKIPVSTSDVDSCSTDCPHLGTDCYARFGPLGMHWRKIGENGRGDNWAAFCDRVKKMPDGQLWRHNQAGDLPGQKDRKKIHRPRFRKLVKSSSHTKGYTYTHYDPTIPENKKAISEANKSGGLTINLSADSLDQADKYCDLKIGPVVVILGRDAKTLGNKTPGGRTVTVCPAQTTESMTCERCKLCQIVSRKTIVGFLAHGTASKRLTAKIESV